MNNRSDTEVKTEADDKCKFSLSWIGRCNKVRVNGKEYCVDHSDLKCSSCGNQATHDCEETMGLVCGAPLCDDCEHTTCENGCNAGAPLPAGFKWHCKKEAQVYKPWYARENKQDIYLN